MLVANTSSTNGGDMRPSESLGIQTNVCTTSENNVLHHSRETCDASDVLLTPRFVDVNDGLKNSNQNSQNGVLKAVQQAVILARCLSIDKSSRHNETQSKLLIFGKACFCELSCLYIGYLVFLIRNYGKRRKRRKKELIIRTKVEYR